MNCSKKQFMKLHKPKSNGTKITDEQRSALAAVLAEGEGNYALPGYVKLKDIQQINKTGLDKTHGRTTSAFLRAQTDKYVFLNFYSQTCALLQKVPGLQAQMSANMGFDLVCH